MNLLLMWFILSNLLLLLVYKKKLLQLWLEPVFTKPVLSFESDDWGPGPLNHSNVLAEICSMLKCYKDRWGNHPIFTIGVVLSEPDKQKIVATHYQKYACHSLNEQNYQPILDQLRQGEEEGVFSIQLHCREHFWPATLLASGLSDPEVDKWFNQPLAPVEALPCWLQSRWNPILTNQQIAKAVKSETDLFQQCFHRKPGLVIPPTFIWNNETEISWRINGIKTIVTPGKRFTSRGSGKKFECDKQLICNGQKSATGQLYLVRDCYFEPSMGHSWQQALQCLVSKTKCARPCLYETHRFNFVGDQQQLNKSLKEVKLLLDNLVSIFPDVYFTSSKELTHIISHNQSELIEQRWRRRLHPWLERAKHLPKFRFLSSASGLYFIVWLLGWYKKTPPVWNQWGSNHG